MLKNKLNKSSELMWVLGTVLVALGVCLCKKADLGVSMIAAPTFIIFEAISQVTSIFSVGTIEYLTQGMVLIIMCIIVRRLNWRYLLAFLVAVIYGYVLDLWILIFGAEPFEQVYLRWIMLFVGDIITATGVACFFRTYMPLQVYELFVAEVTDRFKKDIAKVKWIFDMACLALSITLALVLFRDVTTFNWSNILTSSYHSLGLGTIITTIINAPIIKFMGSLMDKVFGYEALFPKLESILKRKSENSEVVE